MTAIERRYTPGAIRADKNAKEAKMVLSGLAARFDHLSSDLGGWRERLAPGCFAASLASGKDIACLVNHDSSKPLGRRSNGSLKLNEDGIGLNFRCELNDSVSHARDIYAMCQRGDMKECSFGFTCLDEAWGDEDDPDARGVRARKIPVRTVRRCTLHEVSAVTFPAYDGGATHVTIDDTSSQFLTVAASRSLFPNGLPAEVRRRFPEYDLSDPEWNRLTQRGRSLLTELLLEETKR